MGLDRYLCYRCQLRFTFNDGGAGDVPHLCPRCKTIDFDTAPFDRYGGKKGLLIETKDQMQSRWLCEFEQKEIKRLKKLASN